MKRIVFFLIGVAFSVIPLTSAQAAPYSDDLGKCLVAHMSPNDQKDMIWWIFGAIARHPDIQRYSNITAEQYEEMDKALAHLTERLLTQDCKTEAKAAIKYDGKVAFQTAFELAGRVAMTNIMQAPEVTAGLQNFVKYFNTSAFAALKE